MKNSQKLRKKPWKSWNWEKIFGSHPGTVTFPIITLSGTVYNFTNERKLLVSVGEWIWGYFRSTWTVVYWFWAHLIWVPKLGETGEKIVQVNIDIWCKYFSVLYQRSVQLLYEMLETLIEALTAFTVRQL